MKKTVFYIMAFWFLTVCSFTVYNEAVFFFGKEVLLKTTPVDPRELLRGNYVNLKFDITEIKDTQELVRGNYYNRPIYVILNTDRRNIAHIKGLSLDKPKSEFYIKGKIVFKRKDMLKINYGIESYFTERKKAHEFERSLSKGGYAKVKIDKFGTAKIIELLP